MNHPSSLALDEFVLGANDTHETHVRDCADCSAYVSERTAWAKEPMSPHLRPRAAKWPWFAAAFALAAAAVYVQTDDYVGAKGGPRVAVYVSHEGVVTRWTEKTKLAPGDKVQLEVSPKHYRAVIVLAGKPLYEGKIERTEALPLSLLVDDAPGDEQVAVVLSKTPLTTEQAAAAVSAERRDAQVWVTKLSLAKDVQR